MKGEFIRYWDETWAWEAGRTRSQVKALRSILTPGNRGDKNILVAEYVKDESMNKRLGISAWFGLMETVGSWVAIRDLGNILCLMLLLHAWLTLPHIPWSCHVFILQAEVQHDWLSVFPSLSVAQAMAVFNCLISPATNQVCPRILDFLRLHNKWKTRLDTWKAVSSWRKLLSWW